MTTIKAIIKKIIFAIIESDRQSVQRKIEKRKIYESTKLGKG